MIFILLIVAVVVFAILAILKQNSSFVFPSVFAGLFAFILVMCVSVGAMFWTPSETVFKEKLELVSVTTPSGSFYASTTSGSKSGRTINFTIKKEENGQEWNEIESVNAYDSKIFTNENENPHLVVDKKVNSTFVLVPWTVDVYGSETYSFYIPEDSIIENYEIK